MTCAHLRHFAGTLGPIKCRVEHPISFKMEKKEKNTITCMVNITSFFFKKKCSLLENFSTYKKIIKSEESKNDCLLRLLKQQRPTSLSSFNDYPSAIFPHFLSVSQIISPTGFTHSHRIHSSPGNTGAGSPTRTKDDEKE